jgi:hypothetical protein
MITDGDRNIGYSTSDDDSSSSSLPVACLLAKGSEVCKNNEAPSSS